MFTKLARTSPFPFPFSQRGFLPFKSLEHTFERAVHREGRRARAPRLRHAGLRHWRTVERRGQRWAAEGEGGGEREWRGARGR